MKEPPDKKTKYKDSLTFYKTIKTSLKNIIKYDETEELINEVVINVNNIIIHTFHFIKLYYIYQYENQGYADTINYDLVKNIMKIICSKEKQNKKGRKPKESIKKLRNNLEIFYNNHYKPLLTGENNLYFTHLNTLLDYETEKILTCFENHISLHFYDFFNRYVNILIGKFKNEELIKKKYTDKQLQKKELLIYRTEINRLKKDLLLNENKCINKYDRLKEKLRTNIFQKFSTDKNFCYQIKCEPLNFIDTLIKMSIEIENKEEKTFSIFSLRKSVISKYVKIDTTTVLHLLFSNGMNKGYYLTKGNTKKLQYTIWNKYFRLEKKIFNKKGYLFCGEISTDGFSVSILLIREDLYNPIGKNKVPKIRKPKGFSNEKYIDDLDKQEKQIAKNYKIVGIDPGKCDLIYCSTKKSKITTFRYSQIQRNKETRNKRFMKIIEKDKIKFKIKELENELSFCNSKSCGLKNVKEYIKCKNKINNLLNEYYNKKLYRKLRWYGFINRQRSEDCMINNFREKFGNKNETIICFGDYEQKKHLKFSPPTKGIGMRKLFRKTGYKVYLVDEYKTSKINHFSLQENEKFRKRKNPRPWKTNIVTYHGLLRSKSVPNSKSDKQILVNRDLNGSLNIHMISLYHIQGKTIPIEFSRKKSVGLHR